MRDGLTRVPSSEGLPPIRIRTEVWDQFEAAARRARKIGRRACWLVAAALGIGIALATLSLDGSSLVLGLIYGSVVGFATWSVGRNHLGPRLFKQTGAELHRELTRQLKFRIGKDSAYLLALYSRAVVSDFNVTACRAADVVLVKANKIDIASTRVFPTLLGGSGTGTSSS